MIEFKAWPKTPRLNKFDITITEKLDGTNACIIVQDGEVVGCQSRRRLITPDDDNFNFAQWVYDNPEQLSLLGDGYHYGEWVGPGIQKNPHELDEKQFYLFNTFRPSESLPSIVKQVPVLFQGPYSDEAIAHCIDELDDKGSMIGGKPEGIIVYFNLFRQSLKWTFEYQEGKWKDA